MLKAFRHQRARRRVGLLLLLTTLYSLAPAAPGGAALAREASGTAASLSARVLVVYNANEPESVDVANYYVARRGIPAANKCATTPPAPDQILWADFLEAIDNKRPATANIEVGHRATVMPLLGMASWRAGRSLEWDGDKEQILNDRKANELLQRPYRTPWQYPTV